MTIYFDTGESCEARLLRTRPITYIVPNSGLENFFKDWYGSKEIKTVDDDLYNIKKFQLHSYDLVYSIIREVEMG